MEVRLIAFVLGLVFLAGAVLARRANRRRLERIGSWPTAPGKIVAVEVLARSVGGQRKYAPRVSYAYEVEGAGYANDQLHLGGNPFFTDRSKALAAAERYRAGTATLVRYDPARPRRSLLELEIQGHLVRLCLVFAAICLAVAGLLSVPGT